MLPMRPPWWPVALRYIDTRIKVAETFIIIITLRITAALKRTIDKIFQHSSQPVASQQAGVSGTLHASTHVLSHC